MTLLFCVGMKDPQLRRHGVCKRDGDIEDLHVGVCLAHFGIYPIDTRIDAETERFNGRNILTENLRVSFCFSFRFLKFQNFL